MLKIALAILATFASESAFSAECESQINLQIIEELNQTRANAESLAQEFKAIRAQNDLGKKVDQLLSIMTRLTTTLKSHEGRINTLKGLRRATKTTEEIKVAYHKATEEEADRLRTTVSGSRKLLLEKKLSPAEVEEMEFSINGLLDVSISRLESIVSGARSDAEGHLHYCLWLAGRTPLPKELMLRMKGVLVDWMLFGEVINPLRAVTSAGKYNLSLSRIEMLNQKHLRSDANFKPESTH